MRVFLRALLIVLSSSSAVVPSVRAATSVAVDGPTCTAEVAQSMVPPGTTVESASHSVSAGPNVSYCTVTVVISPTAGSHIGAVYRLPDRWNSRFVGLGGGGQAGNVRLDEADHALTEGYATAQTDGGHTGTDVWDAGWAMKADESPNWDALEDFAYRAVHLMTVVGKQLVGAYYGQPVVNSAFQGCSTGGRQALMEAQRFPDDYDAVIAGAPVYDQRVGNSMVAAGQAFAAADSRLSTAQIERVHAAVLAQCDALDGLKDGIVGDPGVCGFDPMTLVCRSGTRADACLTGAQATALHLFYGTRKTANGDVAVFGIPPGSELSSIPRFMEWGAEVPYKVGLDKFRSVQFEDPRADLHRWDVVGDLERIRTSPYALWQDAADPDLSAFLRRGGKLLMWHGLYDDLPRAAGSIEYFRKMRVVTRALLLESGATPALVDQQTRLFLAPGVTHCAGGPGADEFDALAVIRRWQDGRAPERIDAHRRPTAELPAKFTRPWCAYPAVPRYRGRGDAARAESFDCLAPEKRPRAVDSVSDRH